MIKLLVKMAGYIFFGFVLLAVPPFGIAVVGCIVVNVVRRSLNQCLPPDSGLIVGNELVLNFLAVAIPVQVVVGLLLLLLRSSWSELNLSIVILQLLAVCTFLLLSKRSGLAQIRKAPEVFWGWFGDFFLPFFSTLMNLFAGFFEAAGVKRWNKLFGALILWVALALFILVMVCAAKMILMNFCAQKGSIYLWSYGAAIWLVFAVWLFQASFWLGQATLATMRLEAPSLSAIDWNNCGTPLPHGSTQIKLVHLSDLHIPADNRLTESGCAWSDDVLVRCFVEAGKEKPAVIVVTGDVTDTGDKNAWEKFKRLAKDLEIPVVLTPGNHDLNVVGFGALSLLLVGDLPQWRGRWLRMERYLDTATDLLGSTTYVLGPNCSRVTLTTAWQKLKADAAAMKLPDVELYRRAGEMFPMFVEFFVEKKAVLHFVVWNSVRPTRLAINNSYGEVDSGQLDRYIKHKELVKEKKLGLVHLMHHKLALPQVGLSWKPEVQGMRGFVWLKRICTWLCQRIQMAGMVMTNADVFVETLSKDAAQKVLLHGHHHSQFHGELFCSGKKVVTVVSARSTTLGAESWAKGQTPGQLHSFEVLHLSAKCGNVSLVSVPQAIAF